jgi:magnesium chelatase subunit D
MLGLDGDKKASHPRDGGLSFGEIVGQRQFKRALLSVVTDDDLDGLLIRGEKGTAKSTAVRALADLLPEQTAVADCPFGCHPDDPSRQCSDCRDRTAPPTTERPVPLVTLPLGATRERVVGSLSVTDALDGNSEFDPGLLARANRGILYVDEVNLLDDHLVDVLLDAAASGVNRVERDGVSVAHPAEFTLVGTMNPEEGDLRPQLRDRFALQATVTGCEDIEQRVAIVDRALGRTERREEEEEKVEEEEDSPSEGRAETEDPAERLATARDLLDDVAIPTPLVEEVAELCRDSGAEGHRADIATVRAARTLAALDGRTEVVRSDARTAAELTLPHRLQSRPFEDAPDADELLDDHFEDDGADGDSSEVGEDGDDSGDSRESEGGDTRESEDDGDGGESEGDDGSDGGGSAETGDEDGDGEDGDGRSGSRGESERGESKNDGATSPSGASVDGESGEGTAEAPPDSGENADGDAGDGSADDGDADEERTPLVPGQSRAEVGESLSPEVTAEAGDDPGDAGGASPTRQSADADGPWSRGCRGSPRRRSCGRP